jgi:hypothetical protein
MKIFITLILSALIIFAHDKSEHLKVQILETIIVNISVESGKKVWCDDKTIFDELKDHKKIEMVKSCKDASIVILKDIDNINGECSDKHIFTLDYKLLSEVKQSFGALFWKKGRPNIVILEPKIKTQKITVSEELEPYLEEKIW